MFFGVPLGIGDEYVGTCEVLVFLATISFAVGFPMAILQARDCRKEKAKQRRDRKYRSLVGFAKFSFEAKCMI